MRRGPLPARAPAAGMRILKLKQREVLLPRNSRYSWRMLGSWGGLAYIFAAMGDGGFLLTHTGPNRRDQIVGGPTLREVGHCAGVAHRLGLLVLLGPIGGKLQEGSCDRTQ